MQRFRLREVCSSHHLPRLFLLDLLGIVVLSLLAEAMR
jgi:hypothetical protein